jgi:RNA polymerase primary sigma factor
MVAKRLSRPVAEANPLDLYWRDIKDTAPLTREQEIELFGRARAGDEDARQQLVTANLRFVVSVARDYREYGLSLIELVSEGNVGLMEAIRRFDENRGFKFITYAVWWIRQAILKALAENGKITRPPMSQITDFQKLEKQAGILAQQLGRAPTFDELAARVDISGERTLNAMQVAQSDISLDSRAYPDEDAPLISVFAAEQDSAHEECERDQMRTVLRDSLTVLEPREYQILRAYFGLEDTEPMTLEQIGEAMGVTRERVRQLRNRALTKVRAQRGDLLMEFCSN